MTQIGPMFAASGKLAIGYAEKLLVGVTNESFARLASPGGKTVQSNHPAFALGHLCLYPPRLMTLLGRSTGEVAPPQTYDALFKAGAECKDDPQGRIYPPMDEITSRFFTAYRAGVSAVESTDDAVFANVNPNEGRSREIFPTIGAAAAFYLGGHVQNHLGQISAWRRMMGMGPAT